MSIPKPPKEIVQAKDPTDDYLKEWKRLFESIRSDIKVIIYTETNFQEMLNINSISINMSSYYIYDARIFVNLPSDFKLGYLVGMIRDEMYSNREVLSDPLIDQNEFYDCEPETKKWEDFYKEICAINKAIQKFIPKPPLE